MKNTVKTFDSDIVFKFAEHTDGKKAIFTKPLSFEFCPEVIPNSPSVIRAEAYCTGQPASLVYTLESGDEVIYTSMEYSFESSYHPTFFEWRVPPFIGGADKLLIEINIPENSELVLYSIALSPSNTTTQWNGGLRLNAHLGFWGIAPDNTMPAFELAHQCGYPACIVVPKVTKDGHIVCIHDDTINRTARDKNGNEITEPMYVRDMTLEELREYEYGSYKHRIWQGTQIPLLEDFFALCSKTGMRPMFSTHPGLTREQWEEVKRLLKKYGLTKIFHIKSFEEDVLKLAWEIFGTEIEGYTYDVRAKRAEDVKPLIDILDGIGFDLAKVRVGLEIPSYKMTPEKASMITDSGYFAAVWKVLRMSSAGYRELIRMGVTEFTDDYNCSYGLNWL